MSAKTTARIHSEIHMGRLLLAASQDRRPAAKAEAADSWTVPTPQVEVRRLPNR